MMDKGIQSLSTSMSPTDRDLLDSMVVTYVSEKQPDFPPFKLDIKSGYDMYYGSIDKRCFQAIEDPKGESSGIGGPSWNIKKSNSTQGILDKIKEFKKSNKKIKYSSFTLPSDLKYENMESFLNNYFSKEKVIYIGEGLEGYPLRSANRNESKAFILNDGNYYGVIICSLVNADHGGTVSEYDRFLSYYNLK
jgi:hypothetical protein